MPSASAPFPRLVDTVALSALASTSFCEDVFSEINMTITRCCFQELQRGAEDGESYIYRQSCEDALAQIRSNSDDNIHLFGTGLSCRNRYGYLKENIGEKTICRALEQYPGFKLVISFDDDVIRESGGISEEFKQMFRQEIPQFNVFPANEPLYRLYDSGEITSDEFERGTTEMIERMNWQNARVGIFWSAYPGYSTS